jgi:hypothetical protein
MEAMGRVGWEDLLPELLARIFHNFNNKERCVHQILAKLHATRHRR